MRFDLDLALAFVLPFSLSPLDAAAVVSFLVLALVFLRALVARAEAAVAAVDADADAAAGASSPSPAPDCLQRIRAVRAEAEQRAEDTATRLIKMRRAKLNDSVLAARKAFEGIKIGVDAIATGVRKPKGVTPTATVAPVVPASSAAPSTIDSAAAGSVSKKVS